MRSHEPRPLHLILALLFVAPLLAGLGAGAGAQEGEQATAASAAAIRFTDPSGDVALNVPRTPATPPTAAPAAVPKPIPTHVDLTAVRVDRISPTELWVGFTVEDFRRPNTRAVGSATYSVCFPWDATGDTYRLVVDLFYPSLVTSAVDQAPQVKTIFFDRQGPACDHWAGITERSHVARLGPTRLLPVVDLDAGTLDVRIHRTDFPGLVADPEAEPGPYPSKGDTLGPVTAHASAAQGTSAWYYDTATAPDTLQFETDTGNSVVKLHVPEASQRAIGMRGHGVPAYGVETGTYQSIPLELENLLDVPFDARLAATPIGAGADKWNVRLIPRIEVPAATVGTAEDPEAIVPGTTTVTIIAKAGTDTEHKDVARYLFTATDPEHEGVLGATFVDLVAAEPVTRERTTLHFHTTGEACRSDNRWLNTRPEDAFTGGATHLEFTGCGGGEDGLGTGSIGIGGAAITFRSDVAMRRHILLDTAEPITGTVTIDSLARVPGSDETIPFTGLVDITVQLMAGPRLIGEGEVTDVTVPGSTTVAVEVHPVRIGDRTREVLDEDGIGIRFVVSPKDRTFEVCNSSCPDGTEHEAFVPAPTGRLFLVADQTRLDLPVISTRPSGNLFEDKSATGDLVTARLADLQAQARRFINPGGALVYNLTVRNEGLNPDAAIIGLKLNLTGWGAEILPRTNLPLEVGQSATVHLRITAPVNAHEGQVLGATFTAASRNSPEATYTVPLEVTVTTGQQLADEDVDARVRAALGDEEETPAPQAILGIIAAVWATQRQRRRRDMTRDGSIDA